MRRGQSGCRLGALLGWVVFTCGCQEETIDTPTPEPTPTPASPSTPVPATFCQGAPYVTWTTWGQGFTLGACQPCHASGAPDRQGAPADVVFDTHSDVQALKERILARCTGETPDMPPAGGVSDEDRYRLEVWLRCYE